MGLWSLGHPCSQSIHWHDHGVWCVRTSCTCSQSTDGHQRRLRCITPPSAAWAQCSAGCVGNVGLHVLVRHDILQKNVYWYRVKGFDCVSTLCWNRWPVEAAEPFGWCLMEEKSAHCATGCDDHNRLVLVDVVHDRFNEGLDLEAGDVPHVHRCEVLIKNCDALGVDLPTHGIPRWRKAKLAAAIPSKKLRCTTDVS